MLGKTYDSEVCSVARALEAVGERWSLLIIRDALFAGSTRYGEFQRRLGIATNVLTARLDTFVDAGIMRRERSPGTDANQYVLTDKGRDLAPVLVALTKWGDTWAAPDGPPIRYRHGPCGDDVDQTLVCASCGTLADAAEVRAEHGPGMPADHVARKRSR